MSRFKKLSVIFKHPGSAGYVALLISNIGQQLFGFITVLLIAKLLAPAEFATIRIALAYLAVFSLIAAGGVSAPILRYCADPAYSIFLRRLFLSSALKKVLRIALLTMALAIAAAYIRYPARPEQEVFIAYALQLPALAVSVIYFTYLQALHLFRQWAWYQLAIKALTLPLTVAGTYWFGLNGFLVATILAVYVGMLLLKTAIPSAPAPAASCTTPSLAVCTLPKDFWVLAGYSLFGMTISTLGQSADLILLDFVHADKKMIAAYSLASVMFAAAAALIGTAQSILTPRFTALSYEPVQFIQLLKRWSLTVFGASLAIAVAAIVCAYVLKVVWFHESYAAFPEFLAVLMIKYCVWASYAIGGAALVGLGAIKKGSLLAVITTCAAFAIGYPMCMHYGVWGMAWSQVAVALFSAGLIGWLIRSELKILTAHSVGQPQQRVS